MYTQQSTRYLSVILCPFLLNNLLGTSIAIRNRKVIGDYLTLVPFVMESWYTLYNEENFDCKIAVFYLFNSSLLKTHLMYSIQQEGLVNKAIGLIF